MVRKGNELKTKDVDRTGLSERGKSTLAMLTALEDEDKLTEWEKGFVENLSDWFLGKELELTPKQYDRLKIIYDKFN